MSGQPDFYQILHVHPDAPVEIIRASYRTLMQRLKNHPDLGGDVENAALINAAYETLRDPAKRAAYDEYKNQCQQTGSAGAAQAYTSGRDTPDLETAVLERCVFCLTKHSFRADIPAETSCSNCQAPLNPAQHRTSHSADTRAIERLNKSQPIRFYADWPANPSAGRTRDISLNGMCFETTTPLVVDQIIKIDCAVCSTTSRVVHVAREPGLWVVGIEFVTLRFQKRRGSLISTRA